jgi:hypothetical protein
MKPAFDSFSRALREPEGAYRNQSSLQTSHATVLFSATRQALQTGRNGRRIDATLAGCHRAVLANARTERVEGHTPAPDFQSVQGTARIFGKYMKILGNGVTVAQQTLTLFV